MAPCRLPSAGHAMAASTSGLPALLQHSLGFTATCSSPSWYCAPTEASGSDQRWQCVHQLDLKQCHGLSAVNLNADQCYHPQPRSTAMVSSCTCHLSSTQGVLPVSGGFLSQQPDFAACWTPRTRYLNVPRQRAWPPHRGRQPPMVVLLASPAHSPAWGHMTALNSSALGSSGHHALRKRSKVEVCDAFIQRLREKGTVDLDDFAFVEGLQQHFRR